MEKPLPDVSGEGALQRKMVTDTKGIAKGKIALTERSKRQRNWPVRSLDENERFGT
jgi:hypothetical protein